MQRGMFGLACLAGSEPSARDQFHHRLRSCIDRPSSEKWMGRAARAARVASRVRAEPNLEGRRRR